MSRANSRRHRAVWLLLACILAGPCCAQAQQTVAQLAGKIDSELASILTTSSPAQTQQLSISLVQLVTGLRMKSVMVFGARREQLEEKLQQLIQLSDKSLSDSSREARSAA